MNYEQVMSLAKTEGTAQRNKLRKTARIGTWSVGGAMLLAGLIWLPSGPLQSFVRWKNEPDAVAKSQFQSPADCQPALSTSVNSCVVTERDTLISVGEPTKEGEFEFCVVNPADRQVTGGRVDNGTFRVRAVSGTFRIQYKLVKGPCPSRF